MKSTPCALIGIPIFDYLILPRVAALTAMMPLLYMYAAALGILGGFAVAVYLMNISAGGFITHLRGAVSGKRYSAGLGEKRPPLEAGLRLRAVTSA